MWTLYICQECDRPTLFKDDRCCNGQAREVVVAEATPSEDRAGLCDRGCCEWDDEGKVLRYSPHIIGRCDWCSDPITREQDAQRDDRGRLFDSDKCEAKANREAQNDD